MRFTTQRKRFDDLSEQEILALAISSEEDDASIYRGYGERLRADYPASVAIFDNIAAKDDTHRQFILTYVQPGLAGLMDGSVSSLAPILQWPLPPKTHGPRSLLTSPRPSVRAPQWGLPRPPQITASFQGAAPPPSAVLPQGL